MRNRWTVRYIQLIKKLASLKNMGRVIVISLLIPFYLEQNHKPTERFRLIANQSVTDHSY